MSEEFLDRVRSGLAGFRRDRLGRLAFERKLLTPGQLDEIERGGVAGDELVRRGWITPEQLRDLRRSLDAPLAGGKRYELGEKLGEGAMSVVYGAYDRELGRSVAMKLLRGGFLDQEAMRQRFVREAQALARMDHPNVVRVFDACEERGQMCLVMELVRGEPLARLLGREPKGSPNLLRLLEKAARGVQHAHEKGIIHRDLKPENILVSESGEPKVVDFGLAHLVETAPALTRSGTVLGTPMYMAPEQVAGGAAGISERTDVYALGAILYEILTGRPPHTGSSIAEVYAKIARDDPREPRSGNAGLDAIAAKAIEKEPPRRYPSAAAFADDLRRVLDGEPPGVRPASAASRLWRRTTKRPLVAVQLLVALALGIGLTAWRVGENRARRGQTFALKLLEQALPAIERAKAALYNPAIDSASMEPALAAADLMVAEAIDRAPDLPLGHYRQGELGELRGRYERAEKCWRRAVGLDDAFGPAHYRLGRVLLWRAYLASIYFWPDQKAAKQAEGEGLAREGARELEKSQGSGFDNDLQREIAAAMLASLRNDRPTVRRICGEAIRQFGRKEGVEELYWLLGLAEDGPAEQLRAFDEALALRPKFPLALYCRAGVRNMMQNPEGAIRDYDEAIRASPEFAEAYLHRGSIYFGMGDGPHALADFDRLVRMNALLPGAYNGRGRTLVEILKKPEEGIPDLDRAIALEPDAYVLPWMSRAKANLMLKKYDAAIADATKALSISRWPDIYATRGLARAEKGDRDGARADLEAALRAADPSGRVELRAALERLR